MGFFDKVKQGLGIGGAKIQLKVPAEVAKSSGQLSGEITVTSKSDQNVKNITVRLVETYSTGRGQEQSSQEYELGETVLDDSFTIKAGEEKKIGFTLPFTLYKSTTESLKEKGGALGAIGKLGSVAQNERSTYKVKADAKVEGTLLGPVDDKSIRLV